MVAAVGRKIAKEHRKAQTPHGKQSVRKLMGHGGDTNAIEVDTPKLFDKVARKWGCLLYTSEQCHHQSRSQLLNYQYLKSSCDISI